MVKLEWNNKDTCLSTLNTYKDQYKNEFRVFKKYSSNQQEWNNQLYCADNLEVMYYLLNEFENKIDLIYLDPPFFSGSNYDIIIKEQNNPVEIETIAYKDKWENDIDLYLQMLYTRLSLSKHLLSPKGLFFIHIDWHSSHYIRIMLDEIFGRKNFVNEIIWYYYNKYSAAKSNLPRAHDNIFVYSKGKDYTFNELRIPREKPIKQLKREMINGVLKNAKDKDGNIIYRIVNDKKLDDVWRIPCMQPASKQWTAFPTQKHHKLLERIIKLGSHPGDLIADFFCGSGTTLYAAEKLNRRWIGSDISKIAIYLSAKRIRDYKKKTSKTLINQIYRGGFGFEILINNNNDLPVGFFEKNLKIKRKR
ncbi:MAG: DNA adenine methyltransferase YhdJ [Promethearchaeota archaeon]|nr:MAG: DNA adenine methyltransferase YhdJ [Candidatus Lokiarchaeota archaeon]